MTFPLPPYDLVLSISKIKQDFISNLRNFLKKILISIWHVWLEKISMHKQCILHMLILYSCPSDLCIIFLVLNDKNIVYLNLRAF